MPEPAREAVTAAALRRDTATLAAACDDLPPLESTRYDRYRAAAFAAALEGGADRAWTQLKLAGPEAEQRTAVDTAVVELLLGDPSGALETLRAGLEGASRVEPDVPAVLAECRRRGATGVRGATAIAAKRSPVAAAAVVWAAARDEGFDRAVPVLAIAAFLVALVAFGRLPIDDALQRAAPTVPSSREPVVVVAEPPPVVEPPRRAPALPRATSIGIAARTPPAVATRPTARRPTARAAAPRPQTTAAPRPQTTSGGPAPAPSPSPAPAPSPPPEPRTLAAQEAPAAAAPAPPPPPAAEPPARRGRAVGHAKRAARTEAAPTPTPAAAPAPPPASAPADAAPPAAEPGPPAHAQANGHDKAPGQQKKP